MPRAPGNINAIRSVCSGRRAACLRARAPFIVALQPVLSHQGCRDLPVIRGVGPAAFGQSHMRAVGFTDIAGQASTRRQSNTTDRHRLTDFCFASLLAVMARPEIIRLGARIRPMPPHLVSRRALRNSDGDWHAEPCHLVENVARDLRFGPLIGQNPSVEAPANDGLVAIHRGFSQAPAAVA